MFRRVHVIGAGVMGGDIAAWCALRGMGVTLQDLDMERIKPALDRAKSLFKKRLRKSVDVQSAIARLEADPQGKGLARADVVIEAVVENLEIKRKIFLDVEKQVRPNAIIATNTSSIELERIAEGLVNPSRLIGLHFFNPVAQLPLVEVIRSRFSTDLDIARGASFALAIGKSPVVVKSAPGFLVNRVLMPYMLGRGATGRGRPEQGTDRRGGGRLRHADGADRTDGYGGARCRPLGGARTGARRSGELEIRHPRRRAKARPQDGGGVLQMGEGQGRQRRRARAQGPCRICRELVKPLVDATVIAVNEGVVASEDLADIGVIFGTGFAPFLGGPMHARKTGKA